MRDKKQWAWTVAAWGLFSRKITLGKAADCLSSKTMKTLGCVRSKRLSIPLFCWAAEQTSCICKQYAGRPSTTLCSSRARVISGQHLWGFMVNLRPHIDSNKLVGDVLLLQYISICVNHECRNILYSKPILGLLRYTNPPSAVLGRVPGVKTTPHSTEGITGGDRKFQLQCRSETLRLTEEKQRSHAASKAGNTVTGLLLIAPYWLLQHPHPGPINIPALLTWPIRVNVWMFVKQQDSGSPWGSKVLVLFSFSGIVPTHVFTWWYFLDSVFGFAHTALIKFIQNT